MADIKDHKARTHALLSASGSARWLACPRSAAAESTYPETTSPFAEEGTLAHEFAQLFATGLADGTKKTPTDEDIKALADKFDPERKFYNDDMARHAAAYRDYIESRIEHDDAVVLLEQRLDFSPWVPGGFGTGDCIILDNGTMTIIDYKYGKGVEVDATDNSQLKLYALGGLNDYGALYDVNNVRVCIFQPRINNISEWEIKAADLMEWAETILKPTAALAYAGKGEYHAGPHCQFCKHAGACRELAKECRQAIHLDGGSAQIESLAPWEIRDIILKAGMIDKWVKAVSGAAIGRLMNGQKIDGLKLVEGRGSREWTDSQQAEKAFRDDGIDKSKYMTQPELMSPAQVEKALGKKNAAKYAALIRKIPGKPTIAPEADKRPEYKPGQDFEKLD